MKAGLASASNQALPYPELLSQPLAEPSSMIAGTVTRAIRHHGLVSTCASGILDRSKQEFPVSLGPGDRAFGYAAYAPALALDPGACLVTNSRVDIRVP